MNKLNIAKKIIKANMQDAKCGIFDSRNLVGDYMTPLYNQDGLRIDICYDYAYYEVFGLSDEDFCKLEKYYSTLGGIA